MGGGHTVRARSRATMRQLAGRAVAIDNDWRRRRARRSDRCATGRRNRHRRRQTAPACGVSTTRCSSLCITGVASGRFEQLHARVRVLRRDRLVPEVEAEPVRARAAHDAREDERRGPERQVWQLASRSPHPRRCRCRAQLDARIAGRGRGTSACRRRPHGARASPHASSSRRSRATGSNAASRCRCALASRSASRMWPSYACSPPGAMPGSLAMQRHTRRRRLPGEIPERCMPESRSTSSSIARPCRLNAVRQPPHDPFIVHDRGEARRRIARGELPEPVDVRADRLVGEQDVRAAALRQHLGLGDRRALELVDAEHELPPDHLRQLVRLHVRPQPLDAAGDANHVADVLVDAIEVHRAARARRSRRRWTT